MQITPRHNAGNRQATSSYIRTVKIMRSRKGFTLIELIISMALVLVIITSAFSIFSFGNTVQKMSVNEYDLQESIRSITEETNRIARFSTAVFTVPRSSFRENNLTAGWSYVGILNGAIVLYEYGLKDGVIGHHLTVLAPARSDITYKITFTKVADDFQEKIVGFNIQGFITGRPIEYDLDGNPIAHINILSQTEALNSMQVVQKGTALDPAVALAFRGDIRNDPEIQTILPVAQVVMVLDTSGSMNWKMSGSETHDDALRRISYLKTAAKQLIDNFSSSEYPVSISLVPFSTTANNPKPYRSAQTQTAQIKSDIDSLNAIGGTNTGDAIRRAYFQILAGRSNPAYTDKVVSDYIIILVDGVTTFATRSGYRSTDPYQIDNLNVVPPYDDPDYYRTHIFGNGSTLDPQGEAYVDLIGSMVINDGHIKVFVIGFSSRSSDLESVDDIVAATGAGPKYLAGDVDELSLAFGEIKKEILNDLWYIDGPIM
jgi:prepilin-type N-terminal cleavage/methylation domain-containing protein